MVIHDNNIHAKGKMHKNKNLNCWPGNSIIFYTNFIGDYHSIRRSQWNTIYWINLAIPTYKMMR